MTGLVGFASGYRGMKKCDALLMLGTDFPYRQFFPEEARIAQIDLRAAALGNRCPLDLSLLGSVKATIRALLPLIEGKDRFRASERRPPRLQPGYTSSFKNTRQAMATRLERLRPRQHSRY